MANKSSYREGIKRRLDNLRKRHPTHYAQVLIGSAFPRPPAYAYDDPKNEWWSSDDARRFYESLNEKFIYQ